MTDPHHPPSADCSFSSVATRTWAPFTYLSVGGEAPMAELDPLLDRLMASLEAACDAGAAHRIGGVVLRYGALPGSPDVWSIEAGYPVRPGAPAPSGTTVRDLPAFRCAMLLFSGPMSGLGEAHNRLQTGMREAGLQPGGEGREWYLYFQGDSSPNNVLSLQREIL